MAIYGRWRCALAGRNAPAAARSARTGSSAGGASPARRLVLAAVEPPRQWPQTWRFVPSRRARRDVHQQRRTCRLRTRRTGDLVTGDHADASRSTRRSARTSLRGTVALPIALYAQYGRGQQQGLPAGESARQRSRSIDKFFFSRGRRQRRHSSSSPRSARSRRASRNATNNRYTAAFYRVSPYIQGTTPATSSTSCATTTSGPT